MDRCMYAQGDVLNNAAGITALMTACQRWHVTDILALKVTPGLLAQATEVDVRVHLWWCVNHDPGMASKAAAVIAAHPGIYGMSLDYFRDHTGEGAKGKTPARWTAALDTIRAATQVAGIELSLAGVPYRTDTYAAHNFTTVGCCQPWNEWLASGKLDRVLVMEYLTLASFEKALLKYEPLRDYRDKINHLATVAAYAEADKPLPVSDYEQWLDLALAWSAIGVFDYTAVAKAAAGYGAALADRGGEVVPPPPPPVTTTTTLHFTGPVTVTVTGVPA